VEPFDTLVGDRRTWTTLTETVRGSTGSGRLICQPIATQSPILSRVQKGAQPVMRMVTGETTTRAPELDAAHLTAQVRTVAVADLAEESPDDLWLIAAGADLRKPSAKARPSLMNVRALDTSHGPGDRPLTVLGMPAQRCGVRYHRLCSSTAPGFVSAPAATQTARQTVSRAIAPRTRSLPVRGILDRGFADLAVWRTIWEPDEHLVVRVAHPARLVDLPDGPRGWRAGRIDAARATMLVVAQTQMEVQQRGQPRGNRQTVHGTIYACPIRVRYATNVRRTGAGETVARTVWLLAIQWRDTQLEPWRLRTDWAVETETPAVRIFQMYRPRWSGD